MVEQPSPVHITVASRERIGRDLAKLPPTAIHKFDGKDVIVVDFLDKSLPPETQLKQKAFYASLIKNAKFPGDRLGDKASVVKSGDDYLMRFEGQEILEMLVQFGARFDGWEAYQNESLISRPFR